MHNGENDARDKKLHEQTQRATSCAPLVSASVSASGRLALDEDARGGNCRRRRLRVGVVEMKRRLRAASRRCRRRCICFKTIA